MKALLYLNITKLKNSIKDLKHHPSRLILIIFFVAMIVLTIVGGNTGKVELTNTRDLKELFAICFGFFGMLFLTTIFQGFSSGASFFSMADVNVLFQTPISSIRILVYGLIKQMISSIWIGFFILFQYSWIHRTYGLSFVSLIYIFLGYCITFFCSTLTSMSIYSFTCNNEKRKKTLKAVIILCITAIVAFILKDSLGTDDILNSVTSSINSTWVNFVPIIGWIKAFTQGAITGNSVMILCGLGAVIAYIIAFVYAVSYMNTDYYEDVLQATEVSYSAINSAKEGKINDTPKNVKVGKTGLGKGFGASAFFYKHLKEDRRSGILFFDKNTFIFMITSIVFTFFFNTTDKSAGIIPGFAFATYMQLLSCSMGRWVRELTLPYVYLVPENAFKKLVNICKENMLKIIMEAVILMPIIGIISDAPLTDIIACILTRISLGVIFMAGNVLVERIFGQIVSKVLIIFIFFFTMIVIIAPGIVGGIFLAMKFAEEIRMLVAMVVIFAWNIGLSALIGFLCKDILNYAELNNN